MSVSRRAVLMTIPAAAVVGALTACGAGSTSSSGSTSSVASASTASLTPTDPSLALSTTAWSHDATNDVYYQMGLAYGATTQDTAYETLSVFVPGAYVSPTDNGDGTYTLAVASDGAVGSYTAATAPLVLPVNTPGYAAQSPLSEYSYDTVSAYLEAGLVYVQAGLRGKDSTTDSAAGNAPWGVTDLKAAVRYLRYNAASLPGDTEQVYVFGHSGGGAQSAVMGASGDSALYTPYLTAIGAATTDPQGKALSDAVAGAMCWCPITSLNEANAAYEWNMGQHSTSDTRADGTWTQTYSRDLAASYPAYLNSLKLTDAQGTALLLSESDEGVYQAGSYYDYLVGVVEQSLNSFLAATTFPYTPSSTQMAGMELAGGTPPAGATGTAPTGQMPDGTVPGDGTGSMRPGTGSTTQDTTTYDTVDAYIASLNASSQWVTYDASTNTATITGLADFVTSQKQASKPVGALDGVDRAQTENTVFGVGSTTLHFSSLSRDVLADKEGSYASLSGWSQDYASSGYDSDLTQTDSVGTSVTSREQMYNPMYFLVAGNEGYETSSVAPHWRIRTGLQQGDTASTTEVNLALALEMAGQDVDFATVWGQGHTMAEVTGSGEDNFIAWVQEAAGS